MLFSLVTLALVAWLFVIVYASAWLVDRFFLPRRIKDFAADADALSMVNRA